MTDAVYPHELATLLEDRSFDVDVLSLDCFDTLIWRNVNAPKDVFADLGLPGVDPHQRTFAELIARTYSRVLRSSNEVTIEEIYRDLMPDADEAVRSAGVAAELAAERRHCYAFRPAVELMRSAKRRGLKVVIVSDTYLSETQLTELIRTVAGDEVIELIDQIFCSSEFGTSKSGGLFEPVLRKLEVAPNRVLHIGDNPRADFAAPTDMGVTALHLVQFDEVTRERLRLETVAGVMFDPGVRVVQPAFQPHRAALAVAQPRLAEPAEALGYAALGPVFYGFARWLEAEAEAIAATTTGRTHLVFLLRDGHLPKLVLDALGTEHPTTTVQISRFTSAATSFVDKDSVRDFLARTLDYTPVEVVAKRLLLNEREIRHIIGLLPIGQRRKAKFAELVQKPQTIRTILARSRQMADRLVAHVKAQTGAERGDVLVLVDLGYAGTVQDYIEPLLRREMGVTVAGRYLVLRRHDVRTSDKRGLIDDQHYDTRAMHALCRNVAVLEQLSTIPLGSVIGYGEDGTPEHADDVLKGGQSVVRSMIQDACVRFTREADQAFYRRPTSEAESWRHAAMAALTRLMYLPTDSELAALSQFEHDVNLGTGHSVRLFDPENAAQELRRRGIFYVHGVDRMYLPAELRGQGLPISLTSMAARRFGLDIQQSDFNDRKLTLPIIVAEGGSMIDAEVQAHRTHDGYFVVNIPVGAGRYAIGIKFGALYEWVQVEGAWFVAGHDLTQDAAEDGAVRQNAECYFEGIEVVADGLYRCVEKHGFMLVPPPWTTEETVLSVAFRPIKERLHVPVETALPELIAAE